MGRILIAIFVILSLWAKPSLAAPIKWHPGHYYELESRGKNDVAYLNDTYPEIILAPALRGIVIKYDWPELEPSKGVYNFDSIDARLSELTLIDKRLVVMIATKSFTPAESVVPDYLKLPYYEGGEYAHGDDNITVKGSNIKLWNAGVRYRLAQLVKALGAHFNAHPNFEGIGFTETAMGKSIGAPLTTDQEEAYFTNLAIVNRRAREAFPNTMSFQYSNYPRRALVSLVDSLLHLGAGLGCPDVFLDDPGLTAQPSDTTRPGVYLYYPQFAGQMPLVVQVERGNYENTRYDKTGTVPTINELLVYGRDTLHVNYMFWTRIMKFRQALLMELNSSPQTSTPEGGLASACPMNFDSCTN